jgi:phage FluMu protein Com
MTALTFTPRDCIKVANASGHLRVKCLKCEHVIDIDVATQPNLPDCPHCGQTNWQYCKLAIDVLRYVKKLLP